MKITTAGALQKKFKAGLVIAGEDSDGELEFIGSDKQWEQSEKPKDVYRKIKVKNMDEFSDVELERIDMIMTDSDNFGEFANRIKGEMGLNRDEALDFWNEVWQGYL